MQTVGLCGFIACVLAGFVCWASALFHMVRAVLLRKPEVSLWRGTLLNPFNLLLQPRKLSEAGLVARRRCVVSVLAFLGFSLLGMFIGLATGAAR